MSNIAIKGATTGTGVFTIESPATNTDRTLTLPDEAGTVLTTTSGVAKTGDTMTGTLGITKTGVAERTRLSSASSSTVMNAGQINDVYVLNAPFGDNAGAASNNSAKWGIRFTGRNEDAQLDTTGKSACIYAVSEDPGAGYNRAVGLAFHTTSFDSFHREQMRIDNLGRVTMPYQPAFRAIKANTTSFSAGSEVTYSNVAQNIGGHFNGSTGRFTAPVAGSYFFAFQGLTHNVTNYFYFEIAINTYSSSTQIVGHLPQTDSSYMVVGASGVIYLNAGDFVSVKNGYNGGAPYFEDRTTFSGFLVG